MSAVARFGHLVEELLSLLDEQAQEIRADGRGGEDAPRLISALLTVLPEIDDAHSYAAGGRSAIVTITGDTSQYEWTDPYNYHILAIQHPLMTPTGGASGSGKSIALTTCPGCRKQLTLTIT